MRFFKAIVAIIQFVAEKHANPYIETVKVITSGSGDPGESYKLGPYTLTDLQQSVGRSPYTENLADNSLRRALGPDQGQQSGRSLSSGFRCKWMRGRALLNLAPILAGDIRIDCLNCIAAHKHRHLYILS